MVAKESWLCISLFNERVCVYLSQILTPISYLEIQSTYEINVPIQQWITFASTARIAK